MRSKAAPIFAGCLAALAALGILAYRRHRQTYLSFPTRFGRARIYQVQDDDGAPVRLLEVNGIVQSGSYLDERYAEPVFQYLKDYNLLFQAERPVRRICVLGCGGYDYPEYLIAHHPALTVDAVEIDPSITALARRFFFLDRAIEEFDAQTPHRLNLIAADALEHLETADASYDAIVNDTFDGSTPPAHLTTASFYRVVHQRLTPGGLYLANIVAPLAGPGADFLLRQRSLMAQEFGHCYLFPCDACTLDEPDNIVAVATDVPLPLDLAGRSL